MLYTQAKSFVCEPCHILSNLIVFTHPLIQYTMSNRIQAGSYRLRSMGSGSGSNSQQKAAAPRVGTREEQREVEEMAAARALTRRTYFSFVLSQNDWTLTVVVAQRQAMLNAKEKAVWLVDAPKKVRAGAKHARDRSPSPAPSKKHKGMTDLLHNYLTHLVIGKAVAGKQRTRSTAANPTDDTMDNMQVPETRPQPPPAKMSKKSKKPTRPPPAAIEVNSAEVFDDVEDDEPLPPTQRMTYHRDDDDDALLPPTQRTMYYGEDDDDDDNKLLPPTQLTTYYGGDDDDDNGLLPPTQLATYYGDDDDDNGLLPPTQRMMYYGDDDNDGALPPTQRTTYHGDDDDESTSDVAESKAAPPADQDDDDMASQAVGTDTEHEETDEGLASHMNEARSMVRSHE